MILEIFLYDGYERKVSREVRDEVMRILGIGIRELGKLDRLFKFEEPELVKKEVKDEKINFNLFGCFYSTRDSFIFSVDAKTSLWLAIMQLGI